MPPLLPFLSLDGRMRRRDAWVAALLLAFAAAIIAFLLLPLAGTRITSLAVNALLAWPVGAIMAARAHDRDRLGWPRLAVFLGPAVLLTVLQQLGLGYVWAGGIAYPASFWPNMLSFAALGLGLVGAFQTLLLPGTPGANRWGADPRIVRYD